MTNKHKKVWKVVSWKPLSGKQTQPYIHNTFHEYGKLGPRGKKCIFILYSEHSKEFVFIGEKADGRVTEIESCDVVFL
jgi:hypothetical protein